VELDPVDRITADAVGEPGQRTFYLQAGGGGTRVTVVLEKEQVRLLAASILEILQRVGKETDPDAIPPAELALDDPGEGDWRAGRLSIGYQEDRDLLVLDVEELVPDIDEGDEDAVDEEEDERVPNELRVWATREQMLALARHAATVVASGRPNCPFCGHPIDPEGHLCPATNGHREIGSV
jgi:uncharacterized repeat protein (TIGR03847 family)